MVTKNTIQYEEFSKVDVRVGTIVSCEAVEGSEKLLILKVDFGNLGTRQIVSGIAQWYECNDLVGLQTTFVVNLEPRTLMGKESEGMLFALGLDETDTPTLLVPQKQVKNGEGAR